MGAFQVLALLFDQMNGRARSPNADGAIARAGSWYGALKRWCGADRPGMEALDRDVDSGLNHIHDLGF